MSRHTTSCSSGIKFSANNYIESRYKMSYLAQNLYICNEQTQFILQFKKMVFSSVIALNVNMEVSGLDRNVKMIFIGYIPYTLRG